MYIKHILSKYHEPIKKNHLHFILLLFKKLEPHDQGKSYGLEKNHTNKNIKYKTTMSWFLHASISIQNINIYHT